VTCLSDNKKVGVEQVGVW